MSKHTPGPWVHYDDSQAPSHRHQIVALGKTVARLYCTKGREAEDAANARLIAAAPELLEACRDALDNYRALLFNSSGRNNDDVTLSLEQAIAKAEGRE